MGRNKSYLKEEELLLQGLNRQMTGTSKVFFAISSVFVAGYPVWMFHEILMLNVRDNIITISILIIASSALHYWSYINTYPNLESKVAQKQGSKISKKISKKIYEDKKIEWKDKAQHIIWKTNRILDLETTAMTITYNNTIFMCSLLLSTFYVFRSHSSLVNYILSSFLACGILVLFSTSGAKNQGK